MEIKSIDVDKETVVFDDYSEVTPAKFEDKFNEYLTRFVAGETITPFMMERFMKRGSTKNLKQLVDGKKMEGFLEANLGKKVDSNMMKFIIIMVILVVVGVIIFVALKSLGNINI